MLNTAVDIACCLEEERRPVATVHRKLASPEEMVASIRSTGGSRIRLFSRCWRDVQFISITFGRPARIEMPAVPSYSIVECRAGGQKVILPGDTFALSGEDGDEAQLVWIDAATVRELALIPESILTTPSRSAMQRTKRTPRASISCASSL